MKIFLFWFLFLKIKKINWIFMKIKNTIWIFVYCVICMWFNIMIKYKKWASYPRKYYDIYFISIFNNAPFSCMCYILRSTLMSEYLFYTSNIETKCKLKQVFYIKKLSITKLLYMILTSIYIFINQFQFK